MILYGKYVSKLDESDLRRLIENEIKESKILDYKRQLNINDDKEKNRQEFLFDIAAMYNTDGGCLIYGIEEKKDLKNKNTGYPSNFFNQEIENTDKLEQQLHDIVKSNTDPCIVNLAIKFLVVEKCTIIVIGVPKGLGFPSMVTFNEVNKFYRRNTSGKYAVDVFELNQMFMQNQLVRESAEKFITKRVADVLGGNIIPLLKTEGAFFLHAIPFSFQNGQIIDLSKINITDLEDSLYPIATMNSGLNGYDYAYNLDGFSTFRTDRLSNQIYGYNQFFRNGIIEFFTTEFYVKDRDRNYLYGIDLILNSLYSIQKAMKIWRFLEIEPPFLISVNFHAPNATLLTIQTHFEGPLTRSKINLPLFYIDRYDMTNGELFDMLKIYFDIIWQAGGKKSCPAKDLVFGPAIR